jgi:hypothetical protein
VLPLLSYSSVRPQIPESVQRNNPLLRSSSLGLEIAIEQKLGKGSARII